MNDPQTFLRALYVHFRTFELELSNWNFRTGTFELELSNWNFRTGTFELELYSVERSSINLRT